MNQYKIKLESLKVKSSEMQFCLKCLIAIKVPAQMKSLKKMTASELSHGRQNWSLGLNTDALFIYNPYTLQATTEQYQVTLV